MTIPMEMRVRHFNVKKLEALLKHSGDVKLSFDSADVDAIERLCDFNGALLDITLSLDKSKNILVVLAESLVALRTRTGIETSVEFTDSVISFDIPVECLPLLDFVSSNIEFHGVDFRSSKDYWPKILGSGCYYFHHCFWDVEALEALQECIIFGASFKVRHQSESIMRAIGRIATSHVLEINVDDPESMQALYWTASESKTGTYLSLADFKTDSEKWIHALVECDGWLELRYESLSSSQRCALGCLRAYAVKIDDVEDDEIPDLLRCMTSASVLEIIISVGAIDAPLARLIVAWAERKHTDGMHHARLILEYAKPTPRARQIIEEGVSDIANVQVTPARLSISLFE